MNRFWFRIPGVLTILLISYLILYACQAEQSIKTGQYLTNGHKLYTINCQNCHGAKGEGLALLYPPLTDSVYLRENRDRLPEILKHGLSGEIMVNGTIFDTAMPANPQLTDLDIAYILTYITNSFGNKSGIYSLEEVKSNLAK